MFAHDGTPNGEDAEQVVAVDVEDSCAHSAHNGAKCDMKIWSVKGNEFDYKEARGEADNNA